MTLRRNAMLAGLGLLLYIGVGVLQMVIGSGVSAGATPGERLASMAAHDARVQFSALLGLVTSAIALLLGVTFRALTARVDSDVAWLGALCRVAEGIVGHAVENYGDELTSLIRTQVARWDATSASRRIELAVGRDLQFIRLNGTAVGALAGLTIYSVSQLLT